MPLKLIPPGKRKANPFFLVRGRLLGKDYEVSTDTTDEGVALRFKNAFEKRILEGHIPGAEAAVTLHEAMDFYAASKTLSSDDERRLRRLKEVMPNIPVRQVLQAHVDAAAKQLHETDTNETRNRNVYTPAAAVMHYAARNKWCEWIRLDRPKQKQAETRAAKDGVAEALLDGTSGRSICSSCGYSSREPVSAARWRWNAIGLI